MFGKGQKMGFVSLRSISLCCGLLRVFCWWAVRHQGFHRDAASLTLAYYSEDVFRHKLLPTPRSYVPVAFRRREGNGLKEATVGLSQQRDVAFSCGFPNRCAASMRGSDERLKALFAADRPGFKFLVLLFSSRGLGGL